MVKDDRIERVEIVRKRDHEYHPTTVAGTPAPEYDRSLAWAALLLMALVGYQLLRLRRNLKRGVFGSRLALRLVLLFTLVAVLPGALVYAVSVQFLGKSIESWFDVKVEGGRVRSVRRSMLGRKGSVPLQSDA